MQKTTLPPFSCTHTPEFPQLLAELECSLLVSTYQAGKIILIGSDGEQLSQLPRTFDTPMGTAFDGRRLAVATRHEVVQLVNEPRLAAAYPSKPDFYDTLFVPRSSHYCGQLNIHDMAWCQEGLVGVNTLFSCLFRLDEFYSFAPLWRPPFISALVSEDRCHLNGMAVVDDKPRYVTALGHSDAYQGWRDNKLAGGILLDVESGEIVLQALPMPHSPRVYDGRLYVLLSALGQLVVVDLAKGTFEIVNQVNGFVRGLARQGDFLFVGSSRLRHKHIFGDLPLAQGATLCGVVAIHLPTGALVGKLEFLNSCEEIYDVQVLSGWRRPGILGTSQPMYQRALSTPEETFWGEDRDKTE